jgi:hypothetical protein
MLVVFFLANAQAPSAHAQQIPARLDAYILEDSVAIGERFTLVVSAEHGFNVNVAFPQPDAGPLIFGDVQVVGEPDIGDRYLGADAPGMRIDSIRYTVTTFELDSARVPSLPVDLILAGGDTLTGATRPIAVPVFSTVPSDETQLRGLAPLAPFPQPTWPWVLLAVGGVSLAGLLLYLWWNRTDEEEPEEDAPPPEPNVSPYEAAMEELDTLEQIDLGNRDAVKPFYVRLSSAVRHYLAGRLDISAMERTTRELIHALERRPDVPPVVTSRIRAVLELADLVKFSNARATPDDGRTAIDEARKAIEIVESHHASVASASSPPSTNGMSPESVEGEA